MEDVLMPARFRLEKAWGLVRAYPDCDYAENLMQLAGTKTLLPRNFAAIKALGFVCIDQDNKVIDPSELY